MGSENEARFGADFGSHGVHLGVHFGADFESFFGSMNKLQRWLFSIKNIIWEVFSIENLQCWLFP